MKYNNIRNSLSLSGDMQVIMRLYRYCFTIVVSQPTKLMINWKGEDIANNQQPSLSKVALDGRPLPTPNIANEVETKDCSTEVFDIIHYPYSATPWTSTPHSSKELHSGPAMRQKFSNDVKDSSVLPGFERTRSAQTSHHENEQIQYAKIPSKQSPSLRGKTSMESKIAAIKIEFDRDTSVLDQLPKQECQSKKKTDSTTKKVSIPNIKKYGPTTRFQPHSPKLMTVVKDTKKSIDQRGLAYKKEVTETTREVSSAGSSTTSSD